MKFCLFHCGRRDKYTCFSYCISSHRNNLITIDMVKIKHDINFNLFHCVIHILRYVGILFICSINFYCCRRDEYTFFYSTVAPRIYLIIIYMVKINYTFNFNLFHCGTHILRYAAIMLFICSMNFCFLRCCIWDTYIFFSFPPIPQWHLAINLHHSHGYNKTWHQFHPVPLWHPYS